jgi:hypothetical protein
MSKLIWYAARKTRGVMKVPPHGRQSLTILFVAAVSAILAVPIARGDRIKPPRNVHLSMPRRDQPPLEGDVLWYDEIGFQFRDSTGLEHHYTWLRNSPTFTFQLYGTFLEQGTGSQWLTLGKILQQFPTGKPQADLAFDRAVLLDPSLKAQVDAARLVAPGAGAAAPTAPAAPSVQAPAGGAIAAAPAAAPLGPVDEEQRLLGRLAAAQGLPWPPGGTPASAAPGAPPPAVPGAGGATTPDAPDVVMVPGSPTAPEQGLFGGPRKPTWPKLTDEQQLAAVKQLKAFAEGTARFKAGSLKLHETQYFLFYSDLTQQESDNWSALLDKMYARLAELFAVPNGQNLWYGKALVFVFGKSADYLAYEREAEKTNALGTAGICNAFSNGAVHIAFYRQRTDLDFAHVLVHESVHGFVHRYRSPAQVPSWANEGLAETIASELVPQPARAKNVQAEARQFMAQRGMGDDFFTARHIAGWQYPVAESLCTYMIGQNKAGYVKFINAVKDGMEAEDALDKAYGAPEPRLVSFFFDAMKVLKK